MSSRTPTRLIILLCLAVPACAQSRPASSRIPATPATAAPAPAAPAQPALPNRPQISYINHQLTVRADNCSLNQILHEISQLTGITITGGVSEERVFGSYGPGSLSQVLNELLDGTSSNMLFVSSEDNMPAQLILTPRSGGPTPPNPNAMRFEDNAEADTPQGNSPEPPEESSAQASPAPAAPPSSPAQPGATPADAPANSNTNSSDSSQQPASGAKTPQQIYDQLMKLRQQQHQQTQ